MRILQPKRVDLNWCSANSVLTCIEFEEDSPVLVWFDEGNGERASRFDLNTCTFVDPVPAAWSQNTPALARLLIQVVISQQ